MQKTFIPPYKKGLFKTSDGHELYYELWGNPQGKPAVFLHGGPGVGISDDDKRFFDPRIWNVLFFDQRGAGKSKPFASLTANTTQHLIADIQKLMDMAQFEKAMLFGGSWGSTLALAFAITHPERVNALVLRGIYLGTRQEQRYYLQGGVKARHPEAWERFISNVPSTHRRNPLPYYYEKIQHGTEEEKQRYAYEFAYYETSILRMKFTPKQVDKALQEDPSWKTLGPLEIHYIANKCFLPDNFLWKDIKKIMHIPTSIIHGRFDLICEPQMAYTLHKKLQQSKLFFTLAGHGSSEKENERMLIAEVKRMAKVV